VPSHEIVLVQPGEYDSTCASFCPPESTTQTANRSIQPCLHSSRQSVVGHIGATWRMRLNSRFLRPTQVHNPNGRSIGSAVSAQFTSESSLTPPSPPPPPSSSSCLFLQTSETTTRHQSFGGPSNKSSAVAEMGDRLATIDMGRKVGG